MFNAMHFFYFGFVVLVTNKASTDNNKTELKSLLTSF